MDQNINLIEALPAETASVLNAKLIIKLSVIWLIMLFTMYFVFLNIHERDQKKLSGLEGAQSDLVTKIAVLNQNLAVFKDDLVFDHNGNSFGFYRYLEDLAEFTPEGVWLDGIMFSAADNRVVIKGNAISAAGVPVFLDALNKSDDLHGKKFDTLQLQKVQNSNNVIFTLGTVVAAEPRKDK